MEKATFTEQEAKDLYGFINHIFKHAKFDMTTAETFEYARLYKAAADISKKVEAHIMELKKVTTPKDEKK